MKKLIKYFSKCSESHAWFFLFFFFNPSLSFHLVCTREVQGPHVTASLCFIGAIWFDPNVIHSLLLTLAGSCQFTFCLDKCSNCWRSYSVREMVVCSGRMKCVVGLAHSILKRCTCIELLNRKTKISCN